jgi:hypothetical protein
MDGKSKVHRNNNTLPTDFCLVGTRKLKRSKIREFNDDAKPLLSAFLNYILTSNLDEKQNRQPKCLMVEFMSEYAPIARQCGTDDFQYS